jgi:hypothetical protein
MRAVAPSLFMAPAPTIRFDTPTGATAELIDDLRKAAFDVFEAGQGRSRAEAGREQTRHYLRLRHKSQSGVEDPNEVVLLGGPVRHAPYSLFAGVCRTVNQNDLVCVTPIRQVRRGAGNDGGPALVAAARQVMADFPLVDAHKRAMKDLWMSPASQLAFADAARGLLQDTQGACPVSALQLLQIVRPEDNAADLWTTLNRVHEHLMRGGLLLREPDGRRYRTRGLVGVDDSIRLSRALWRVAEAICELKLG